MVKLPVVPVIYNLPVVALNVPLFKKVPVTVKAFTVPMFNLPPALIVTLVTVLAADKVMVAPLTIIAVSAVPGATPPTQLDPVDQVPPVVVLVIVAASACRQNNKSAKNRHFLKNKTFKAK